MVVTRDEIERVSKKTVLVNLTHFSLTLDASIITLCRPMYMY